MFYIKTLSFMKTRLIFLLPLLWMLIGCSDSNSDSATLEISQSTFDNINSEGSIIKYLLHAILLGGRSVIKVGVFQTCKMVVMTENSF